MVIPRTMMKKKMMTMTMRRMVMMMMMMMTMMPLLETIRIALLMELLLVMIRTSRRIFMMI